MLALHTTFRGTAEEKASAVSFWGFRAPLGAWVAVLGCGAMLTSAPFDDWWHDAYGLDVRIVSPPHIVLGLGMMGIVLGALLRTLALQNASDGATRERAAMLFAVSSGFFLTILAMLLSRDRGAPEHAPRHDVPHARPRAAGRDRRRRRRGSRTMARHHGRAVYMALLAGTSWVLMLFPATPKLGPDLPGHDSLRPARLPAAARRPGVRGRSHLAPRARPTRLDRVVALGAAFLVTFVAVQWPFADFLMRFGRNWFFHIDNFVYWRPRSTEAVRVSLPRAADPATHRWRCCSRWALLYAILASALGRAWGRWMTRVQR